jgi:hypothetical protein
MTAPLSNCRLKSLSLRDRKDFSITITLRKSSFHPKRKETKKQRRNQAKA